MRQIFLLLLFVFTIIPGLAYGLTSQEREIELGKVRSYIELLDQKIIQAREARKIDRVAWLKELKRKETDRAEALRQGELEPSHSAKVGWLASAGFSGGATSFGLGYPFKYEEANLVAQGNIGIGNQYSVIGTGLAAVIPFSTYYLGSRVSLVNYSKTVSNIVGVPGTINQGTLAGLGAFVGTKVGELIAQVGYDTNSGIAANVIYKF
ncbi:MAG: hypothetical protein ABIE84_05950 [bacterium]